MSLLRRQFLQGAIFTAVAGYLPAPLLASVRTENLYAQSVVIDGLGFPGSVANSSYQGLSVQELDDLIESGVSATHLTVGEVGTMSALLAFERVVRSITYWDKQIASQPNVLMKVRRPGDIVEAAVAARTGLIYGLQDGVAFENDINRLDALHHLGVRIVQPTYNRRNLLGDGCMEPADAGLSLTGREAVGRLNELGMLIDLSHCGRRTASDAISASRKPVAFTHTGCHALVEHPRHRTDAELRAVAQTGGVSGIFIMPYLAKGAQPTAADVIRHLEHALNVAGEDHVSLGSDGYISPTVVTDEFREQFKASTRQRQELGIAAPFETEEGFLFANDLNTARRFETLSDMLLQRGHSEAVVEKILGANLMRVFDEVWI